MTSNHGRQQSSRHRPARISIPLPACLRHIYGLPVNLSLHVAVAGRPGGYFRIMSIRLNGEATTSILRQVIENI